MEELKTILITQARTGSTRLPGKVLLKINEKELLKIHLDRLSKCKLVDQIIVATTENINDDQLSVKVKDWGFKTFRGSENDVLDRFYQAIKDLNPKWVVRVTSDCPLIDPELVDAVIACVQTNDVDYGANILIENFPDGQDIEVFKFSALKKAWSEASLKSEREHVTPYLRKNASFNQGNLFSSVNFPCGTDYSKIRMTVDEQKDFELMEKLIHDLGTEKSWLTYTKHIQAFNLNQINEGIIRNEGFLKSLKKD